MTNLCTKSEHHLKIPSDVMTAILDDNSTGPAVLRGLNAGIHFILLLLITWRLYIEIRHDAAVISQQFSARKMVRVTLGLLWFICASERFVKFQDSNFKYHSNGHVRQSGLLGSVWHSSATSISRILLSYRIPFRCSFLRYAFTLVRKFFYYYEDEIWLNV